jgi:hypothetical protein
VSGAGYVASAVQVRKPVVSHHDHNHRLILPSSPQVRKPVFNAFKLLREAGPARWGVAVRSEQDWAGSAEAPVLFAALSNAGRAVDLVFANHEQPALNLSVALVGAAAARLDPRGATLARVDDGHANAYSAWRAMGSPAIDPAEGEGGATLAALHAAAALREEPLDIDLTETAAREGEGGGAGSRAAGLRVVVRLPHHGVARARIWLRPDGAP